MLHQQHNQKQQTKKPYRANLQMGKSLRGLFPMGSVSSLSPAILALTALVATSTPVQALQIHFDYATGTSSNVIASFEMAANILEDFLADNITLNIEVAMVDFATEFGDGQNGTEDYTTVLGMAIPTFWEPDNGFEGFQTALVNDVTSDDDERAVQHLQDMDVAQYISDNNYQMTITQANAKALGIDTSSSTAAYDGQIRINSNPVNDTYGWDYTLNYNEGQTGDYDFHYVSVALHEIAHVLGFSSGIDNSGWQAVNEGSNTPANSTTSNQFMALDAYRINKQGKLDVKSVKNPNAKRYFSIDSGTTKLAEFSTGVDGDGSQASHWKNKNFYNGEEALGIMDPSLGAGQRAQISTLDFTAFDAIGWDLADVYWDDNCSSVSECSDKSASNIEDGLGVDPNIVDDLTDLIAAIDGVNNVDELMTYLNDESLGDLIDDIQYDSWDDLNMTALALDAETEALFASLSSSGSSFNAHQSLLYGWYWWGWQGFNEAEFSGAEFPLPTFLANNAEINQNSVTSIPEPGTIAGSISVGLLALKTRRKRSESKSST